MTDNTRNAVVAGMAAGYLLGRTKKGKVALGLASVALGRRLKLSPGELLTDGLRKLSSSPHVGKLAEQVREELMGNGRTSLTSIVQRGCDAFADTLSARTKALTGIGAGEGDEEQGKGEAEKQEQGEDEDQGKGEAEDQGKGKGEAEKQEQGEDEKQEQGKGEAEKQEQGEDKEQGKGEAGDQGEDEKEGRSQERDPEHPHRRRRIRTAPRRQPREPLSPRKPRSRRPVHQGSGAGSEQEGSQ